MDQNAFLRTICSQPDDDAPRLIYADWLDEHGDPLGEFIRVQIELAKFKDRLPRFAYLRARQLELMLANVPNWVHPYGMEITGAEFWRGFMCSGSVSADVFFGDEPWFARWPWEVLQLGEVSKHFDRLLICPMMAHLKYLFISGNNLSNEQLVRLARSPFLKQVGRMELGQCAPDRVTASALRSAFGDHIHWHEPPPAYRIDLRRPGYTTF
jgi:uncharacterized protein (TIGR02996 family)